jgi:release factor glutamine methyltransferase
LQATQPIDIKTLLNQVVPLLSRHLFIENPRLEAEILLCDVLSVERPWLYSHSDYQLTTEDLTAYMSSIQRRISGEPLAYVREKKEFWSLEFKVTPATLIPRPETELLVETALQIIDDRFSHERRINLLELGTGSGAIAIALAHERPNIHVVATDISYEALHVAYENAITYGVSDRIRFVCSDWFAALKACRQFHLIIANPPYISHEERNGLSHEVLNYEPALALFSDEDGLKPLRLILSNAAVFLQPDGHILCEIGWKQGKNALKAASIYCARQARIIRDYGGRDRVLAVCIC